MDLTPWLERWKEGRIGFHEGSPNQLLSRHITQLGMQRRVLVPLCGKTEDMVLLAASGHEVVGIELAEVAVRAFFEEHGLTPNESQLGSLKSFSAGPITLLAGDFFACTREHLGTLDAFYDRAALVALPAALRGAYVHHLRSLLLPAAKGLVITFEYTQAQMAGPPFSVSQTELCTHYANAHVEQLEARATTFGQGDISVQEACYLVSL